MDIIEAIINNTANWGDWTVISMLATMGVTSFGMLFSKVPKSKTKETPVEVTKVVTKKEAPVVAEPIGESWASRLSKGLSKTRDGIWGKVQGLLSGNNLTDDTLEEIEELLYSSDMSATTINELITEMRTNFKPEEDDFKSFIKKFFAAKLEPYQKDEDLFKFSGSTGKTKVIMIVGVNGAGKTTTIGKLATKLKRQGAKVVVGACDTFRAAAIEQLEVWCERADVELVKTKSGADPSGVAYETLQSAINSKADYCLLDTAGRLHNKTNLMDELNKTKRVLAKLDDTAPHETLLVIDSITGQNALRQAEEFNKYLGLSGLILTKCDGSSKAGNAISMVELLKVPIVSIGVGEDVDDLNDFNTSEYLNALIG